MVAVEKKPGESERGGPRPWHLSRGRYEQLAVMGAFGGTRVELVHGAICEMSPEGPRHANRIDAIHEILTRVLAGRARVRMQHSFIISDESQLEPDLAVVPVRDYEEEHPSVAFLIIEVSDTSLAYDRGPKAAMYAQAAVPEYWVVDVRNRWIEVHDTLVDGQYTRVTPYKPGETIRPLAFTDVAIAVADIFA